MHRRRIRLEHQLQIEISNIIQNKLEDGRIKGDIITVTSVNLSPDLRYAKVYISSLGGLHRSEELTKWLNRASGYIQTILAKTMELRFTPTLLFIADDSIEHGAKVEELIYEIFSKDDSKDTTDNQGE